MATLTVQPTTLTGLTLSMSSASAGGDKFAPGPTTTLVVTNGSGASKTVTIDSVAPSNFGTDEDVVVVVAAGATTHIGPFPAHRFAGSDGLVAVTYSAVTSVTVAAKKV